jgi:hypothetical protein
VFQTSKFYKDLNILNLKSLCYKNVCILMYDVKDDTVMWFQVINILPELNLSLILLFLIWEQFLANNALSTWLLNIVIAII